MLDKSGAIAYTNAKIHGMLQKSFVGSRAEKLFSVNSLPELWALLFKDELPSVPELMLAKLIEKKALENFIVQYKELLEMFAKPDKIYLSFLQYYEFENLKKIGTALCLGKAEMPEIVDLTPYNLLNYKGWPKISEITENTEFSWYDKIPNVQDLQSFDNKLDLQYLRTLWNSAENLSGSEKKPVRNFILQSIIFKNILWVLRLKVYYNMNSEDILNQLVFENPSRPENDLFASAALSIINWDVRDYAVWADWKYADCINPKDDEGEWMIDPCWVGQCFRKKENESALSKLHQNILTPMVLVCWFKIKQNEYETICAAVEAIRLGVEEAQAMELIGVAPTKKR